jgi:TatD DNase family protein
MELFDTHCHLDVEEFDEDRVQVLRDARAAGVRELLVPAIRQATWPALRALCADEPGLYPAIGLHPVFTHEHRDSHIDDLAAAVAASRPTAIGEIGLDYQVEHADRERQRDLLDRQLAIAAEHRLPVVLHVRKAHDDMLGHLRAHDLVGGFCHAFNGSLDQAARYIDLGFCLGFGGMLTFERSTRLRRLATELPLDALVLETDAPDLTVASHRYQRNSPAYLPEVLEVLAGLRNAEPEHMAARTSANAHRVLGLSSS